MTKQIAVAVVAATLIAGSTQGVQAAGCIKGAMVGGVAGHFAHHPIAGAAIGCVIGHHRAAVQRREARQEIQRQENQTNRGNWQGNNR
jgi:hypothetical protein